jgi:superfamily II DNA/RNA helicase
VAYIRRELSRTTSDDPCGPSTRTFKELGIREDILRGLSFDKPKVAYRYLEEAAPSISGGRSVIPEGGREGDARTTAMAISLVDGLGLYRQALVMVPSDAQAESLANLIRDLGKRQRVMVAALDGTIGIWSALKDCDVTVGTPKRVEAAMMTNQPRTDNIGFIGFDDLEKFDPRELNSEVGISWGHFLRHSLQASGCSGACDPPFHETYRPLGEGRGDQH